MPSSIAQPTFPGQNLTPVAVNPSGALLQMAQLSIPHYSNNCSSADRNSTSKVLGNTKAVGTAEIKEKKEVSKSL